MAHEICENGIVVSNIHCIIDTSFELTVFWTSDTESQIKKTEVSDPLSLSFKTRLASITYFTATLRNVIV